MPSTASFDRLRKSVAGYVEFERGVLFDASVGRIEPDTLEHLHANHDDLVRSLNTVQWDVAGSNQLDEDALNLRRVLLAQVELCGSSVFPNRSVLSPSSP